MSGPPIQPCCGQQHPLPWLHPGEIRCMVCGQAKPPAGKRENICKDCRPAWEAMIAGGRMETR